MIGSSLNFLAKQLNQYVCNRLDTDPAAPKVVLSSLVTPDGTIAIQDENVLVVSLVSIRKEDAAGAVQSIPQPATDGFGRPGSAQYAKTPPPVHLNLMVMLAAHFRPDQMQPGLDLLGLAITFLQANPYWDRQRQPGLPKGVDTLAFEMEVLDFDAQGHLWGAIGAKYLPSALYKMKMLTLEEGMMDGVTPSISIANTVVTPS